MSKAKKTTTSKIENKIMAKINSGQIKMHSRVYYILISILSITVVGVLTVILSYLLSLTALWARIQTAAGPAWGAQQNLTTLVDNFPWWAVILAILAIVALVVIVKKVGSLYKVKLLYLIPAIVLVALLAGWGLSYTNLPNAFKGRQNQLSCQQSDTDDCVTKVQGRRFLNQ